MDHYYETVLLSEPARRPWYRGFFWFFGALGIIFGKPLAWLMIMLLMCIGEFGIVMFAHMLPFVLGFLLPLGLWFYIGIQCAADEQVDNGDSPRFAVFVESLLGRHNDFSLLLSCFVLFAVFLGVVLYGMQHKLPPIEYWSDGMRLVVFLALGAVLNIFWMGPLLVFLQGEEVWDALHLSVQTFARNILPYICFLLLQGVLVMGLNYLVEKFGLPVSLLKRYVLLAVLIALCQIVLALCAYAAYKDIWFEFEEVDLLRKYSSHRINQSCNQIYP